MPFFAGFGFLKDDGQVRVFIAFFGDFGQVFNRLPAILGDEINIVLQGFRPVVRQDLVEIVFFNQAAGFERVQQAFAPFPDKPARLDGGKVVLSVPRGKLCQVSGFEGGVIGVRQYMGFDLAAFDFIVD
ncbi:TPA: hypothetical protein ACLA64_000026 [Neisseria meningitidis]